jgi:hypothetical protein
MSKNLHVVSFNGPFGFIKPWTAVRDKQTYSQQFLTPSTVEGMRQKLEVEAILRHKITHEGFSLQQERIQSGGWKKKVIKSRREATYERAQSIVIRGVMLNPVLHLAFSTEADADRASQQHLCLSRNEDVVFPTGGAREMTEADFDQLPGFELQFGEGEEAFMVGYNRYEDGAPMYGTLETTGDPVNPKPLAR